MKDPSRACSTRRKRSAPTAPTSPSATSNRTRRQQTITKIDGLEFVTRRVIAYAGARFEEMDTEAVLRRKPAVAVIVT